MRNIPKDRILDDLEITHSVQPVVELFTQKVHGFEFLFRSKYFQRADLLFQYAKLMNRLNELDKKSIASIFSNLKDTSIQMNNMYLFINVYPSTLLLPEFNYFLLNAVTASGIKPDRVVIEINGTEEEINWSGFKEAVKSIRKHGFLICLDNVGKANASVKTVIEIEPNIVKLDLYFSQNLSKSPKKQSFIRYFNKFLGNDTMMILEGIENEVDLRIAKQLGVTFGQGYALGVPKPIEFYQDSIPKAEEKQSLPRVE